MASVHAHEDFDAEKACGKLRKAMKGAGTDEKTIIEVLTSHNNDQRQEIKKTYKTMYGRDLEKDIHSEISGQFEDVALGLLQRPAEYLAHELRKAMKGAGTKESVLIEILCTRPNEEVKAIRESYKKHYDRDLEEDIQSETSKDFRRLLVSQVNAARDENPEVDEAKAVQDAKKIFEAGEAQMGTDESVFNTVLCLRSFRQLRETFKRYAEIAGKDIEESIKSETTQDLEDGYLAVVRSVKDIHYYYAHLLYKSMKGAGTNDDRLVRIMVSRSEVDMEEIRKAFLLKYGQSLPEFIKDDTSGDYRKILLGLLGEH